MLSVSCWRNPLGGEMWELIKEKRKAWPFQYKCKHVDEHWCLLATTLYPLTVALTERALNKQSNSTHGSSACCYTSCSTEDICVMKNISTWANEKTWMMQEVSEKLKYGVPLSSVVMRLRLEQEEPTLNQQIMPMLGSFNISFATLVTCARW